MQSFCLVRISNFGLMSSSPNRQILASTGKVTDIPNDPARPERELKRHMAPALIFIGGTITFYLLIVGFNVLSGRPAGLGVIDGELAPVPRTPNAVSTFATDDVYGMPALAFDGSPEDAMASVVVIMETMPRTSIVERNDDYLRAEVQSAFFRFVDDVEFLVDSETSTVHFRSASRLGHSDLGVNRKRMEEFSERFQSSVNSR